LTQDIQEKFTLLWSRIMCEFITGMPAWAALSGPAMAADTGHTVGIYS